MEKNVGSKEAGVFLDIYRLYTKLYGVTSWAENDIDALRKYLSKLVPMIENGDIIVDFMLRDLKDGVNLLTALQQVSEGVLKLEKIVYKPVSTEPPVVAQKPVAIQKLEALKKPEISKAKTTKSPLWQGIYPKHLVLAKYQTVHIYSPIVDAIMDDDAVPDEFTRENVYVFLTHFYKDTFDKEVSIESSKVYARKYINYLLENKRITEKDDHFIKQSFRTALSARVDKDNWASKEETFLRENFFKLGKSLTKLQTFLPSRTTKQIHDKAVFMGLLLK